MVAVVFQSATDSGGLIGGVHRSIHQVGKLFGKAATSSRGLEGRHRQGQRYSYVHCRGGQGTDSLSATPPATSWVDSSKIMSLTQARAFPTGAPYAISPAKDYPPGRW